jgi:hypothetical protein
MKASGQLHVQAALPRGNNSFVFRIGGLGEPCSRSGTFGEGKKILPLVRFDARTMQSLPQSLFQQR